MSVVDDSQSVKIAAGHAVTFNGGADASRCAKCLYDRRATPRDQPCPECGYVLAADALVVIVPRQPRARKWLFVQAALIVLMIGFVLRDVRGSLGSMNVALVLVIQYIATEALRALRLSMNPDAYTSQVWLTPRGIGFVSDVDGDAFARGLERTIGLLLSVFYFAAVLFDHRGTSFWPGCIAFGVITFIALVTWLFRLRHRRRDGGDPSVPPLTPWARLPLIEVTQAVGPRIIVRSPVQYGPLKHFRMSFQISAGREIGVALAQHIADCAHGSEVRWID